MEHELVVILDFGGQLDQLLARRVREQNVYCEILPVTTVDFDALKAKNPKGIFLVGYTEAPDKAFIEKLFSMGVPVMAVGLASQVVLGAAGGKSPKAVNDLQKINLKENPIFKGIGISAEVWTKQLLPITSAPVGFEAIASSDSDEIFALYNPETSCYLLQFSPEISGTKQGSVILKNFLYEICGAKGDWTMKAFAEHSIKEIRKQVGDGKVLLALSGGVDSSVVASLLEKAVGEQLYCIFVDHGLMRKNEGNEVEAAFGNSGMHFVRVDGEARFLEKLKDQPDPETKRKIIGEEFIRVFEEEAKKIGTVDFFAQGTIYPDIIESDLGDGKVIKSHHNVGGLPDHVDFKEIIEPLKLLFKDEVRLLGEELGLASNLVWRQPFPGPGLAVRVIGGITKERLDILRDADFIFREEIAKAGIDKEINQYFAVITDMRSVGVSNDTRTYDYTIALRGVVTNDFMTAEWARIPFEILDKVSKRIVSEVDQVNRIVYDITSKPPATIEWE